MKKIMSTILVICLLFTGCSKPPDNRIASDSETFKVFERLFGENYLYACSSDQKEWFIRQNLKDNYIEILAFTSRKIMRYELSESLKYTEEADSSKLEKAAKRRHDAIEDLEPVFTNGNLSFLMRGEQLIISMGNKKGNILKTYECPIISSTITPQIQQVVKSGTELLKVVQDDTGEFFLCSDFSLAYVKEKSCSVYRYNSVLTFPIMDELPDIPGYDFPSSFFSIVDDLSNDSYILKAYGLDKYDIIIAYGDYYLCANKDGKSQLLYNRTRNFYEWIRGE